MFLRNVGCNSTDYTVSYPRRWYSSKEEWIQYDMELYWEMLPRRTPGSTLVLVRTGRLLKTSLLRSASLFPEDNIALLMQYALSCHFLNYWRSVHKLSWNIKNIVAWMYINHIIFYYIVARMCGNYIRRVLDWHLDLLDHSQLHTITVNALLQLTTVHYNTCRVFTLYLHSLPVSQYHRIRSPATLQLFSEDCCSARMLTRNCPSYIARERTPKKTPPPLPLLSDVITGTDHKENASTVAWLSIVARLSIAIAAVVSTCHIAYSMHVTLSNV
jgi:hypothetical protein